MGSDAAGERAYPYWPGWRMVGCSVLFFGMLGAVAVALLPAGCDRVRTGDLPTGVAMMVMGVFGVPTLTMSAWSLVAGVRDTFRPPLLRLTALGLVLPAEARGEPPQDEHGEPLSADPPHPAVVPFATITGVRRHGPPYNQVLEIGHEASAAPLVLKQHMMRAPDFDALEAHLRAARPDAFAAARRP
ncbi:MAG: hypothetical protein ACKODX_13375 [Gemmata sp.]